MGVGPFAFTYQGNGATPCQCIDTTERQLIALQLCRWQFLYNETLQQTFFVLYCRKCPKDDKFRYLIPIFTARRYASAVLLSSCVRPSVCPSVTRRYCVKTTASSTMQFSPLDSKMCLALYKPKKYSPGTTPSPEILAQSDLPTPEGCEF